MGRTITVVPEDGLHARPASKFVQTAGGFDARVTVSQADGDGSEARADSMLAVTGLGVRGGDDVRLVAEGPDAEDALDALEGVLTTPADELEDDE